MTGGAVNQQYLRWTLLSLRAISLAAVIGAGLFMAFNLLWAAKFLTNCGLSKFDDPLNATDLSFLVGPWLLLGGAYLFGLRSSANAVDVSRIISMPLTYNSIGQNSRYLDLIPNNLFEKNCPSNIVADFGVVYRELMTDDAIFSFGLAITALLVFAACWIVDNVVVS
jgi:hypothetical protein